MKETIKLGLILLIITVASAGVLAISNNLTKDKIAELEMAGSLSSLKEIFGEDKDFKAIDEGQLNEIIEANGAILEIFEVNEGDNLYGYAIKTKSRGFGDTDLVIMTGFANDGTTVGIRVLEHSETPGLGAKAEEPEFTDKFVGKATDEEIKVDVLSGATVTTNGVLSGVNAAREVFNTQLSN